MRTTTRPSAVLWASLREDATDECVFGCRGALATTGEPFPELPLVGLQNGERDERLEIGNGQIPVVAHGVATQRLEHVTSAGDVRLRRDVHRDK
jgi:hypothetical protein